MTLRSGTIVGGYRILRQLGSGGMGTVYLAQNPSLPRQDALKILSADLSLDAEYRARFEREANLAATLDHPNLVTIYNRGEENGRLWIAMQYVDGTDAAVEVAKGPSAMSTDRAMRVVAEIGKGLDHAHRRGLLHRDVKPANFLLARADGDEERVLLTDFGVAKAAEDGQELTATGNFMATVAYASPEQLLGERLDARTDVYSLGCALYRLLTGQNPYPSQMPAVVMMGHLHEPPPRITALRPDLPAALDDVIAKVLAKDPAHRYSTCKEFTEAARSALYGSAPWHPASTTTSSPGLPLADTGSARSAEGPTDQYLVTTVRRRDPRRRRTRRILLGSALALVIAVAVVAGTYFLVAGDGGAGGDGERLARVRAEHPGFGGKSVIALHFGDTSLSAVLTPSSQAEFLQAIGFRFSEDYRAVGAEKSPRELSLNTSSMQLDSDVVIVIRTDRQAGNGGFRGLPTGVSNSSARIVVVDDPAAVQAFRVWTPQSTATLVDRMVPVIAKAVG